MEILSRLQVKSLIRFKCVCKSWWAFVESPTFIAMHANRAKNNERVLIYRLPVQVQGTETKFSYLSNHSSIELIRDVSPDFDHSPFCYNGRFVRCLSHCNGLVFLSDGNDMYICNPALREFRILPPFPFDELPPDLSRCTVETGFGYDEMDDDYKVVTLANYHYGSNNNIIFKAEIYSLKTDSWRQIDAMFQVLGPPCSSVFFNGFIHWKSFCSARERPVIFSFHMSTEVFQEIELPDDCVAVIFLDVLGESLALISTQDLDTWEEQVQDFDVWVMTKYGVKESWTKIFHIGPEIGHPLACWKNEHLLCSDFGKQVILCSLTAGQELRKFDAFTTPAFLIKVIIYKESLISIKRKSDQARTMHQGSSTENSQK